MTADAEKPLRHTQTKTGDGAASAPRERDQVPTRAASAKAARSRTPVKAV